MRIISVAYKLKALHRIARQGRIWGEEMSRSNQEQRKILAFARRHGDAAACEAYEVSRRTLRRWRNLARTRGEAFLGDCRGGRSGRRSGRKADRRQVAFIRAFRADRLHMNAGKEAVKPALDAFSRECGLPPLSVSTIGRLIADAPDGMRASPRMDLDRRGRVKPRKRRRNHERRLPKRMSVRNPGDLVALDTVEIRPVGGGARLFLFTAVDHHSRLAFAMAFPKRNAQCAAEFLRRLLLVLPVPVLALLSDNGAEFQADFDRLADRLGLRRFFIFPSCPQAERAQRALQPHPAVRLRPGQRAFRRRPARFQPATRRPAHLVQCPKTTPRPRRKHPLELPAFPTQKLPTTMDPYRLLTTPAPARPE